MRYNSEELHYIPIIETGQLTSMIEIGSKELKDVNPTIELGQVIMDHWDKLEKARWDNIREWKPYYEPTGAE